MSVGWRHNSALRVLAALPFTLAGFGARAAQTDVVGPTHSVTFGASVTALPNGNFVVTDPDFGPNGRKLGAVYLHGPTGTLISALRGRTENDRVGSYGVTVLANGNFVVLSPAWNDGKAAAAGAVTWVNGSAGLSGVVSSKNSLVGTQAGDNVGNGGVRRLTNGNFVVSSYSWSNGATIAAGAVTWIDGNAGLTGPVSIDNSLVGTQANEALGYPFQTFMVWPLDNGDYVVADPNWNYTSGQGALGAVMLADGRLGARGTFSESNSLIGAVPGDSIGNGGVFKLSNGNYVVASPSWRNGNVQSAGAVTWVDGKTGLIARVSVDNSLVGSSFDDFVGSSFSLRPIVALANGNYVVATPWWSAGAVRHVGAVTWGDGSKGIAGAVSPSNSLVGTSELDEVGLDRVAALSNGNYVVGSSFWNNGSIELAGAVTWADGTIGISGPVSSSNSLVGTTYFERIGGQGIRALSKGNYVVTSPGWTNGTTSVGAVTWVDGNTGLSGLVTASNSLVGATAGDGIGAWNVTALANGNYVVDSPFWNNSTATRAGAVTWADGGTGLIGVVDSTNSLVGTSSNDQVGYGFATPLSNGNYIVASPGWSSGSVSSIGAITWGNGRTGISGPVSAENSLIGISAGDNVGGGYEHSSGFLAYSNSTSVVGSPQFDDGTQVDAGAVSLIRGSGGTVGPVNSNNSVIGTVAGGGEAMVFDYDPTRDTLVVGQPAANMVSLFKADLLYKNGFE